MLENTATQAALLSVFSRKSCFHLRVTAFAEVEAEFICKRELESTTGGRRSIAQQFP
jgi:hypothetical protein